MPECREVTARFYGADDHRARNVPVLVRGQFAGAEEYISRAGRGIVRTCDVVLGDPDGHSHRFVIYYTVGGTERNRAVHHALGRLACGDYLVLAAKVNGGRTHYTNVRSTSQAKEALDEMLEALDLRGGGPYPKIVE